jgi:photosystem II stability/assembly factor-like uncharacterized protein
MVSMRTGFLLLIGSIWILFSCHKTADKPAPAPAATSVDTLLDWEKIDSHLNRFIEDIWFVSPSKGFFLGGDGNTYQTLDSGLTWTPVANAKMDSKLNLFFTDPQHGFVQGMSKLQITRDGGNTWTTKSLATNNALTFLFTSPSTGYYGNYNTGLYRTTDTGTTWKLVYSDSKGSAGYYTYFFNPDTGYVVTMGPSLAMTTDAGMSWQPVANNLSRYTGDHLFNQLQFVNSSTGFYGNSEGVLKTTDGGHTWENVFSNKEGLVNLVKFFDIDTGYCKTDQEIYKTTDGGQTWSRSCKLNAEDDILGMYFIDQNTGWACTNKGFVLRLKH